MEKVQEKLEQIIIENETGIDYCEVEEESRYYGGFYIIWKGSDIIHIDYFIFHNTEADHHYKADKLLWEKHEKDFQENPCSELNEAIKNLDEIELDIVDTTLFNPIFSYDDIKIVMEEEFYTFKKNYQMISEKNIYKNKKDNYNMKELIKAIKEIEVQAHPLWYPFF